MKHPPGRQVGGHHDKGSLAKGTPASVRAHSQPTDGGTGEKGDSPKRAATADAFCCRTNRFAAPPKNDVPGPGAYHREPELTWHKESLSSRGYSSGFVSRDKRFAKVANFRVPGPGSYSTPREFDPVERVSPLPPRASSCFAAPLREDMQPPNPFYKPSKAELAIPGPGNYDPKDPMERGRPSAHAVFKSRSRRTNTAAAIALRDNTPAPGEYEPMAGIGDAALAHAVAAGERISWDGGALPSSMFRSATTRQSPPIRPKHPLSIKEHIPVPEFLMDANVGKSPGPGAYSVVADNISQRVVNRSNRKSSMFMNGEGRFPSPLRGAPPGPGAYNVDSGPLSKNLMNPTKNAFQSKTQRRVEDKMVPADHDPPPGPAFYHPKSPERRSHHMNCRNLWM